MREVHDFGKTEPMLGSPPTPVLNLTSPQHPFVSLLQPGKPQILAYCHAISFRRICSSRLNWPLVEKKKVTTNGNYDSAEIILVTSMVHLLGLFPAPKQFTSCMSCIRWTPSLAAGPSELKMTSLMFLGGLNTSLITGEAPRDLSRFFLN